MKQKYKFLRVCEHCNWCIKKYCVPQVCTFTGEIIGNFQATQCEHYNDEKRVIPKAYLPTE